MNLSSYKIVCNGRLWRRVETVVKPACGIAVLLAGLLSAAVCAAPYSTVLVFSKDGGLLAQAPAAVRYGGYALVPRHVFHGAYSAAVLDESARLHPVLWITADDQDSGVLEVYVGAQAPKGIDLASRFSKTVHTSTHESAAADLRESGAFGPLSLLTCPVKDDSEEGPLYDEHGLLAGWHVTRVVDGRSFSFGIPIERFERMPRSALASVGEWAAVHDAAKEAVFRRGMGHLWANDFDGALFYLRKATEEDPRNARPWYHLAFVEGKNGHGQARLECYRRAIALDPNLAGAHYYLAYALLMGGDAEGAQKELEILRKLDKAFATKLEQFLDAAHVDILGKGHDHGPAAPKPAIGKGK